MCTSVAGQNKAGEHVIADTVRELCDLLGVNESALIVTDGIPFKPADGDCCLCSVDVRATASALGLNCRAGWEEAGCDFILTVND